MVSITENESRTISFLLRNFSANYNINQIARELKLSPRGAYKILKKLESQKILTSQKIGNNLIYRINFSEDLALEICQLVLNEKEASPYLRTWINDLQPLKNITKTAVLFGSVLAKEKQANDVDLLLVFEKERFAAVQEQVKIISQLKTKKIHLLIQTSEDLVQNIRKSDPPILEAIKTGKVLWGRNVLVEAIKNGED